MKCSIIIPYDKDRGYLFQAIQSVREQTVDCELIISTGFGNVSSNINAGTKRSSGSLIAWLPEDDLMPENAAELAVKYIKDYDFLHGSAVRFNDRLDKCELYEPKITNPTVKELVKKNHIHGGTTWYRRKALLDNPFNEDLNTAEEYELHLRMLSKGCKLGYVNEVMFYYRLHDEQKSIGNLHHEYQAKRWKTKKQIKEYYADYSSFDVPFREYFNVQHT